MGWWVVWGRALHMSFGLELGVLYFLFNVILGCVCVDLGNTRDFCWNIAVIMEINLLCFYMGGLFACRGLAKGTP